MGAVANDLARLRAGLPAWQRAAATAAARAYQAAEVAALARVAPGGRLSGLPHAGPLGATLRPARTTTAGGVAVDVAPTGPVWAVEFRRRGGYPIRPRRRGGVLRVGDGFAAHTAGGPITHPRRPWHAGATAGRQPAVVAVRASFDAALAGAMTGGDHHG